MQSIKHAVILGGLLCTAGAAAQDSGTAVSFPPLGQPSTQGARVPAAIPGTLVVPSGARGPVPAVVIVHGSGGLRPDGPEAFHGPAFAAAGIATLTIDMWTPRGIPSGAAALGGGSRNPAPDRRPAQVADTLPDAFGALKFLSGNPAIDRTRIGIAGFSWGATVALLSASAPLATRTGGGLKFAAHAMFYAPCWPYLAGAAGAAVGRGAWTGAPLLLLAGGKDDYEDSDGGAACRTMMDNLVPAMKPRAKLVVFPEATHAWDSGQNARFEDPRSHRGRGGAVVIAANKQVAEQSRAEAVQFFKTAFKM